MHSGQAAWSSASSDYKMVPMSTRLRQCLTASQRAILGVARQIGPLLRAWRFVRDRLSPHHRALRKLAVGDQQSLLQPSNRSWPNRYPTLFDALADRLAGIDEPRILSFGCAMGDEVFTLRHIFPAARITGIDINPRNIAEARKRLSRMGGDSGISFECAASAENEADRSYDAILALAVLRHGDLHAHRPHSCAAILPFAKVERAVEGLVRCLASGGLLAIWNCHYRFCDMKAANGFAVEWCDPLDAAGNFPLYGPGDGLLPDSGYEEGIFRKLKTYS